ncbi:MAG: YggS family pyridoxal phosphate-dependent enzyme [Candidatus Calescibacterium sp.]|nr:YggS family pyridoxal phosphate-dependent enzyme [Candidatus Calescibacterium sp.]MCX7734067.1 YggS family pyridoxal phosphate-dependent enzyme [bacterium]MDW8087065.1 YggS family pyridoxal phosphate-dependent enzyme [Candidatus Calescibacterium sp.]
MSNDLRQRIIQNVQSVLERVKSACLRAGRRPSDVRIVAVSKTFPPEYIRYAYEAGIRDFGENYFQEAFPKMNELGDLDITWHFIGRIQSNKIKNIYQSFSFVHSLSSENHIIEFEKRYNGKKIKCFVQINIGEEKTKSGIYEEQIFEFIKRFFEISPKSIELVGLMTIPPPSDDPEKARQYFVRMRKIRDKLISQGYNLPELSMGMTDDFEVAIEEGASFVRIGRAIFGERK